MDDRVKEYEDGTRAESQWDLRRIVSELRTLRGEWRQNTKPDGVTYELPSQEALSDVLEGLSAALFQGISVPRHLPRRESILSSDVRSTEHCNPSLNKCAGN